MTTSDDTKVDTSGWEASGGPFTHTIIRDEGAADNYVLIATFPNKADRDACLLAIQSLPKMEAENAELRVKLQLLIEHSDAQRDALSARVKELEAALMRCADKMDMFIAEHADPGPDAFAAVHCARALIGKEPSK